VGADGRAILAELGYATAEIDRLFADGTLVENRPARAAE
jgi:hypothetical protein